LWFVSDTTTLLVICILELTRPLFDITLNWSTLLLGRYNFNESNMKLLGTVLWNCTWDQLVSLSSFRTNKLIPRYNFIVLFHQRVKCFLQIMVECLTDHQHWQSSCLVVIQNSLVHYFDMFLVFSYTFASPPPITWVSNVETSSLLGRTLELHRFLWVVKFEFSTLLLEKKNRIFKIIARLELVLCSLCFTLGVTTN
jgi:hypothetical protein